MIIYGSKSSDAILRTEQAPCARCGRVTPHAVKERRRKAHVYWVPLFTIARQTYRECTVCEQYTPIDGPTMLGAANRPSSAASDVVRRPDHLWLLAVIYCATADGPMPPALREAILFEYAKLPGVQADPQNITRGEAFIASHRASVEEQLRRGAHLLHAGMAQEVLHACRQACSFAGPPSPRQRAAVSGVAAALRC